MTTIDSSRKRKAGDIAVSLTLAALVLAAWLANHIGAIFLIDWSAPGRWPLAIALIALQTWLSVGLFIIAHDSMHGSLAPGWPRLNKLIGQICVRLYAGFSYAKLYVSHHDHHRHAGTPDDPDFDAEHNTSFWPWYFKFFRHYFGWREFGFLTAAVIVYAIILGERTPVIIAFWAIPAILSSIQLFYFGTFLPHRVGEPLFTDQHRARSNDFSWPVSLLTCFHFGYHHEHHDKPWVPWWRLPHVKSLSRSTETL
jgi:beta-carotene ketolase (CrtW type)